VRLPKVLRTRKTAWITVIGTVGGLAMLAVSFLLPRIRGAGATASWLSGLLLELGAAVLLFVPLYLITLTLERDIDAVREETVASVDRVREATTSSVAALTERVSSFEGDIERRMEDLVASVSERLAEERDRDVEVREALRKKEPTWSGLLEALDRAMDQGLITDSHPPRVVGGPDLWGPHVSVIVGGDPELPEMHRLLRFRVESLQGKRIQTVEWYRDDSLTDVMVRVARIVEGATGGPFRLADFFPDLSRLLEVASSAPERRPIVQLCPPLWAVTTRGVVPYGRKDVRVWTHEQVSGPRIAQDMATKPWSDEESFALAQAVSGGLFPAPLPF
jgi:hypothetical protein